MTVTSDNIHVFPVNDLVEHDTDSEDCVCGPDLEPVRESDDDEFGPIVGWLVSHHALDGRR